jgi:hypothetical protein
LRGVIDRFTFKRIATMSDAQTPNEDSPGQQRLAEGASGIDFPAHFAQNGLTWGAGDMFVVGSAGALERIAEMVACLAARHDEAGKWPLTQIVVVRPSGPQGTINPKSVLLNAIGQAVLRARGSPLDQSEETVVAKRVREVASPDMQVESVLSIIRNAAPHSAIIVTDGALYRSAAVNVRPMGGMSLPEDVCVPHFHALCAGAIEADRHSQSYVALDAGEEWPSRLAHRDLLMSIDGCGVVAGETPEGPHVAIAHRIEAWSGRIAAGETGPVLAEIEALPTTLYRLKPLLRVQVLHKAGLHPLVLQTLKAHPELLENIDSITIVQFAMIAADAGAADISATLLKKATHAVLPEEYLEAALSLAQRIGDSDLVHRFADRLAHEYPKSTALRTYRAAVFFRSGKYRDLADLFSSSTDSGERDLTSLYSLLADKLPTGTPDYATLLSDIARQLPGQSARARRILSSEALRRGDAQQALSLAVSDTVIPRPASVEVVLDALEQLLLTRDAHGQLGVKTEQAQSGIAFVIRYLAQHPTDGTRLRLARAISAQSMGLLGLALLATVTLEFTRPPIRLRDIPRLGQWARAPHPEALLAFMQGALPWLAQSSPIMIGRTTIPSNLLTLPADQLIAGTQRLLEHYEPIDETLEKFLAVGTSIVPHGTNPDDDLTMLRIVAVRFALASRFQKARDFAEHGLLLAGDSPRRARLAWLCFADVYERTGNSAEALVAIACGLSADPEATPDQLFYESLVLFRLMRGLRMFDRALSFLQSAQAALRRFGALQAHQHRLDTLILQTRLLALGDDPHDGANELPALIAEIAENARAVIKANDDPAPVGSVLGQALRQAETIGVAPPEGVADTFQAVLQKSTPAVANLLRSVRLSAPSAMDVLAVIDRLESAREAGDMAFDMHHVVTLAQRLLTGSEASSNPVIAAFGIELLTDHGVALPGVDTASTLPDDIGTPGKLAAQASRDLPLVLMGIGADRLLLRVTARDGSLEDPVRETADIFSQVRLINWSQEFPYRYGTDDQTLNLFHTSTEGIGVSQLPPRALLIPSATLQHFPPNLIRLEDDLAGNTRKLAVAPSLAWFHSARNNRASDGRTLAWISTAPSQRGDETLKMIAERVREPFQHYGVALDEGPEIPTYFENAALAIVVAHGSLIPEGRYFQLVQNDADLTVPSSELSDALAGVGVAVLFICSGGRLDTHPLANTTLGLARQILGRGCRTVIGSPWPLDARVAAHWLPTFLRAWESGDSIIDANFKANSHVRHAFSPEPRDYLAMNVYGDPLRKKGD